MRQWLIRVSWLAGIVAFLALISLVSSPIAFRQASLLTGSVSRSLPSDSGVSDSGDALAESDRQPLPCGEEIVLVQGHKRVFFIPGFDPAAGGIDIIQGSDITVAPDGLISILPQSSGRSTALLSYTIQGAQETCLIKLDIL